MTKTQSNANANAVTTASPVGWRSDRLVGAMLALAGAYAAWEAGKLPLGSIDNPGPGYLPLILATLLVALGVLAALAAKPSALVREIRWVELRHAAAIISVTAFAALAIEPFGYRLTVAVMLIFLLGVVERKPPAAVAAFAAGMSLGSYWLFSTLLKVPLPPGLLGF